ncbi:MAG: DsrE/DsrF/DrsH-like family protein [Bacillota bacterium]|jgi:peroxiredoxin family protein
MKDERATLILFSGDLDKAMAAFTIANGAAGQGLEVYMYFTFWGLALLRKETGDGTLFLEKMFKRMMPVGPEQAGLSQMNFAGAGSSLIKMLMDQKGSDTLPDLMQMAMERSIQFIACEASMQILGIKREELLDYQHLQVGCVKTYLAAANGARLNLFI